uniref:Uncharacterized protein n=1 Tax=Glossina palpalis gambiensis TaxID=67801 RepID=A0A1B0C5Z6_9MUSC
MTKEPERKKEKVFLSFPRNLFVTVDLELYSKSTDMSSNMITHRVCSHLTFDNRISCIHIIERLQTLRSKLT